jgi:DNA-binding XRE family transcriptional regulator
MKAGEFKRIRSKLGLTQDELGYEINRSRFSIIAYEDGSREIPLEISLAMKYLEGKQE